MQTTKATRQRRGGRLLTLGGVAAVTLTVSAIPAVAATSAGPAPVATVLPVPAGSGSAPAGSRRGPATRSVSPPAMGSSA